MFNKAYFCRKNVRQSILCRQISILPELCSTKHILSTNWSEGGTRSVRPEREVSNVSIFKGGEGIGVGAGFPSARGRISVGSGPDFRRLGAGFPSARGRIPVAPGPSARARGSGALPRSRNLRMSGLGRGRGGGPKPHFTWIAAIFRNFSGFHKIP